MTYFINYWTLESGPHANDNNSSLRWPLPSWCNCVAFEVHIQKIKKILLKNYMKFNKQNIESNNK